MVDMKKLVQAVRDHSGMEDDEIREAGKHGADTGWPGFTYTRDCVAFYEKNKQVIWDLLADMANDAGMKPLELVMSFNRADMAETHEGFANLLAWFALEEAGRWLEDNRMAASKSDDSAD